MKKWILVGILFLELVVGYVYLGQRYYMALAFILLSTLLWGVLLLQEKKEFPLRQLVLLALLVALSVMGRFLFSPLQGFKPITALAIITGKYLGGSLGFLQGALSGLLSNFYFGQGPWTPFQMMAWGSIGFASGLLAEPLKNRGFLMVFAIFSGIYYSLFMDIWTVLALGEGFKWELYLVKIIAALPTTMTYILSNVVFLFFLEKPIGKRIERIETKYGLEK